MAWMRFYGLLLPFETHAREGDTSMPGRYVRQFALTQDALDGSGCFVDVDHDQAQRIGARRTHGCGAVVQLLSRESGVYAIFDLPSSNPVAQTIYKRRAEWRGLSIQFGSDFRIAETWCREAPSHSVKYISECPSTSGLAVCIDRSPAFADTWVTDNEELHQAQVEKYEDAFCRRRYGASRQYYLSCLPEWQRRQLPPQSKARERVLQNRDPDRAFALRVMGFDDVQVA